MFFTTNNLIMVLSKALYWPTLLVVNHHAVRRFICFSTVINQHEFHLHSVLRSSYQFFGIIQVITLVFLFLVRCRFPVQLSIISVLRKRYGDKWLNRLENLKNWTLNVKKHRWIFSFCKCARVKMLFRIF